MKELLGEVQRKHLLLVIYSLVFLLLLYGVIQASGWQYVPNLLLYFSAFIAFYVAILVLNGKLGFSRKQFGWPQIIGNQLKVEYLAVASLLGIAIHFIFLGNIPTWDAYKALKLSEVVIIRRNITENMPIWVNYMMSWNLKSLIPFTLAILFIRKDHKWFWIFFPIAVIYAFLMMQKSFILVILMPLGILAFITKRWGYLIMSGIIALTVVVTLFYVQNVTLRGGFNDIRLEYEKEPSPSGLVDRLFGGLLKRVSVVPGKTVAKWFEFIPNEKPYLYGNGYKAVSKLTGGEYHDYARELYPYIYKENAKHGLVGSVNVASFMRGYANFGLPGLVLAAFLLAIVLLFIESIYAGFDVFKFTFNAFPVLMLSSTSLETNLASGGWLLTTGLFLLFRDKLPVLTRTKKTFNTNHVS